MGHRERRNSRISKNTNRARLRRRLLHRPCKSPLCTNVSVDVTKSRSRRDLDARLCVYERQWQRQRRRSTTLNCFGTS
jgi:hypothetical protein